jgi:chemotaxis methyl-accepting protein methylase
VSDHLDTVADLVERETGIRTKESQLGALAAALGRISAGMDATGFLAALNDPSERAALLSRLIDEVAIQETFFMREPRELEAVDWQQLLAVARSRGAEQVTVWVSACASGEEAYSLAMLAAEAFGDARPPVSILATDVSDRALRRAQEAVYSERSMHDVGEARQQRFFTQEGRRSKVGEQLRAMVRFAKHNLVGSLAPLGEGPFDLILCRNVLIYFSAKTVEAVVTSLESALRPGGQLILGASDRLSSSAQRLAGVAVPLPGSAALSAAGALRQVPRRQRRQLRKPLGRADRRGDAQTAARPAEKRSVKAALRAADAGEYAAAIELADGVLADDPLDAEAYFVRGLTELAGGDPGSAIGSLRRALYIDPTFALAAFQLAHAWDARGDARAARRAYAQTLRALDQDDARHQDLAAVVDVGDIAAACRARLAE